MHLLRNKTTLWGGSLANAMRISVSNAARPRWLRIRFLTYPNTSCETRVSTSGEIPDVDYGVTNGRNRYEIHRGRT